MSFNKKKFKNSYTFQFIEVITNKRLFLQNMIEVLPNEPNLLDFIILPGKYVLNFLKLILSIFLAIVSFPLSLLTSVEFKDVGGIKNGKKYYDAWRLDLEKVDYIIWNIDCSDTEDRKWALVYYKKGKFVHWKKADIIRTLASERGNKEFRECIIRLVERIVKNQNGERIYFDDVFTDSMFFKAYLEYVKNKKLEEEGK